MQGIAKSPLFASRLVAEAEFKARRQGDRKVTRLLQEIKEDIQTDGAGREDIREVSGNLMASIEASPIYKGADRFGLYIPDNHGRKWRSFGEFDEGGFETLEQIRQRRESRERNSRIIAPAGQSEEDQSA